MSNSVSERVIAVIADELRLKTDEVKPERNIEDDLGADSLDSIEILMSLEEEFDVCISDEDAMDVRTVQDVINMVSKYVEHQQPEAAKD